MANGATVTFAPVSKTQQAFKYLSCGNQRGIYCSIAVSAATWDISKADHGLKVISFYMISGINATGGYAISPPNQYASGTSGAGRVGGKSFTNGDFVGLCLFGE